MFSVVGFSTKLAMVSATLILWESVIFETLLSSAPLKIPGKATALLT